MDHNEKISHTDSGGLMAPMHPMRSTFHVEVPFTILFREWNVDSTKDAVLSCFLLLLLSFFYECVKHIRSHVNSLTADLVEEKKRKKLQASDERKLQLVQTQNGCQCIEPGADHKSLTGLVKLQSSKLASAKGYLKSSKYLLHFISCFLYGIEMFISFGLMLSVMSFHIGVLASVVVGGMVGKFVLSWPGRLQMSNEEEDHCH